MAANTSQGYHGNIDLSFDDGTRTIIPSMQILYIMIEEDYSDKILPMVFISISVNNDLFNRIINKRETAHFNLSISSSDVLSYNSVSTESMSGRFKYIPETTTSNYAYQLNYAQNDSTDISYRVLNIGLISEDQTAMLRKPFNGAYRNIDSNTLVSIALEGMKNVIVEPLENNHYYDQIVVPPVASVYKFLEYIFNYDAFYNTQFRFFMGFNQTYLLSQRGQPVTKTNNAVLIDIRDVTSRESMIDGMEMSNGAYHVYVSEIDVRYTSNMVTEQISNQIVAFEDNTGTVAMDLNNNGSGRTSFVRSDQANVLKNEIDSTDFTIEVVKQNVDGSIFTPDKQYSVSGNGDYALYNGNYILVYKRVFYKSIGDSYVITCNLGLKPTSDNATAHIPNTSTSKATSRSATKQTSASAKTSSASTRSRAQENKSQQTSSAVSSISASNNRYYSVN